MKEFSFSVFQFHKGTIKTVKCGHADEFVSYFNSIKVRLKLSFHKKHLNLSSYFNSIKVRLKLKLVNYFLFSIRFQFHKGTIKTR